MSTHGVTLVELLVTLAVIAVLAAITVPNLHASDTAQDAADLTLARQAVTMTRSEALARGVPITLTAHDHQLSLSTTAPHTDLSDTPTITLSTHNTLASALTVAADGTAQGVLTVNQTGQCTTLSLTAYGDLITAPCPTP